MNMTSRRPLPPDGWPVRHPLFCKRRAAIPSTLQPTFQQLKCLSEPGAAIPPPRPLNLPASPACLNRGCAHNMCSAELRVLVDALAAQLEPQDGGAGSSRGPADFSGRVQISGGGGGRGLLLHAPAWTLTA